MKYTTYEATIIDVDIFDADRNEKSTLLPIPRSRFPTS